MIKIGIIDDDELYLSAMKIFLGNETDMRVVATATDLESGIDLGTEPQIDVILMDCTLSPKAPDEGVKATEIINTIKPNAKIIFLTSMDNNEILARAFISGALNYIRKCDYTMLPDVIRTTNAGGMANVAIAFQYIREERRKHLINKFTPRELEIIELMKQNMKRKEIAETLFLSENTVKTMLSHIYKKFDIESSGNNASKEALKKVMEWGL